MSRRMYLSTAGAVAALIVAPLGALHSQTPQDTSSLPSPPTAQPTPTSPAPSATGSRAEVLADSGIVHEALKGNLLEVRLGTLAGSKASNSAVKAFGRRLAKDHKSMYDGWASLAKANGLSTAVNADATGKATADRLSTLSGADFDRAYMSEMVRDHQADIVKFQQAASTADAAGVRELAAKAVPIMQEHLTHAQQVASQVGTTAVATTPTPNPSEPERNVGADDRQYINEVAVGHLMEVRLAEMAQNKARDPDVKKFADHLHDDFSRWLSRWEALGVKDPHMGQLHRQKIERLDKANRNQFDRTYVDIVRENLASMIPYFEKEGRASKVARVRNLVNDELPTLRQHLQAAERLARQARADRSSDKEKDRSLSSNK